MKTEPKLGSPQCQYLVPRKKRLCRMTVRPGRSYCGEHEPKPADEDGQPLTRVPCPLDPKHTCYANKLEKHLAICNARQGELPPYIVKNINAPGEKPARRPLTQMPSDHVLHVVNKVKILYEKVVEGQITTLPPRDIHSAVLPEFNEADRTESSRRHLRQTSRLMWLLEEEGLVADGTCYVELGAGKGQLSYFAWQAWCGAGAGSGALLVDRAALRHKKDNKLRGATRLRADLADLVLSRAPPVEACQRMVGVAKHLCGAATDLALRCVVGVVRGKDGAAGGGVGGVGAAGAAIATCCHHSCDRGTYVANQELQDLGITAEDFDTLLGIVSWATCGDGRPRRDPDSALRAPTTPTSSTEDPDDARSQLRAMSVEEREAVGRKAKALIDWGRLQYLKSKGFDARLSYFVPTSVSPENVCIIAKKLS